jgi:coproporphyrinogen III oxidase
MAAEQPMKGATAESLRERAAAWIVALHDRTTAFFEAIDGVGRFREDPWERPGGGGGVSRVLTDGALLEKAGVNRSAVDGALTPGMASRLTHRAPDAHAVHFYVTGMSVVAHPRTPMVPTVHLNVRYFELTDAAGQVTDAWVGGGTDLTPTYPFPDDARHFHHVLRDLCARHDPTYYDRFKAWCDEYFVNLHRGNERRGVGGVFFDHLRPDEEGRPLDALLDFADEIGRSLAETYGPIVERRRDLPYGERERRLQLLRRGRYVEFNLVHDRGTLFGLQTQARIESVLMSLPPLAAWEYAPEFTPGSIEAELHAMLEPRDWTG